MPIVEGRYEAKLSTTFRTPKEGIKALKEKIKKSRKVRINNVPTSLVKELIPVLEGKDVAIILPMGSKPTKQMKEAGRVAVTAAKIYKDHKGTEALLGSVNFSDLMFNIVWARNRIVEIDTMEYAKCVKCLNSTFEMAWRYSKKA